MPDAAPTTPTTPTTPTRSILAACGLLAALATSLAAPLAHGQTDPLTRPFPAELELAILDGGIGFRIAGERSEDRLGQSVAPAGDVNGDGIDDLIIGASQADARGVEQAGSAYVLFGRDAAGGGGFPALPSLADLDGTNGFHIDGVTEFGNLGFSVAGAGDVNGDGIDDVIVGAPQDRPGGATWAGSGYVVYGRGAGEPFPAAMTSADLAGVRGFRIDGATAFGFAGWSVSAAGDLNNDGIDDVVISAYRASPGGRSEAGSTYVLFGRRSTTGPAFPAVVRLSDLDGTTGFRLDGAQAVDQSGSWVAPAGDINHDGLDDIIIGAWRASPGGRSQAGSSYLIYGRDSGAGGAFPPVMRLADLDGADGFRLDGAAAFDVSGRAVAGAGDVNNDGVDDVIVGAPSASPEGRNRAGSSYVLYGRDAASAGPFPAVTALASLDGATGFRIDGIDPVDFAGWSVAAAGDLNGDGLDDVIIGALQADPGGDEWAGESYVVYGRDAASGATFPAIVRLRDLESATGFQLNGMGEFTQSGFALASAGDVNGDGMDDVIISAPRADGAGGDATGECYVVYGRDPVRCPPDLNGDGSLDVADFLAFQNLFDAMDPAADFDGDGEFTLFDFLAFQNAFAAGCP